MGYPDLENVTGSNRTSAVCTKEDLQQFVAPDRPLTLTCKISRMSTQLRVNIGVNFLVQNLEGIVSDGPAQALVPNMQGQPLALLEGVVVQNFLPKAGFNSRKGRINQGQ